MIKIVGLGPGEEDALTLGAMRALRNSNKVYLRTKKHPTVDYIEGEGIIFETLDECYESSESFDEVYGKIAEKIIKEYQGEDLVYGVPGHPLVAEKSVFNLINLCEEKEIEYEVLPAVSFVDAMMDRLKIDPINGLKIIDAFDIKNQILDKRIGTIITQVYNGLIASEVKLALSEYYNDETEIVFCRACGIKGEESIRRIPLYELDMQEDIDYLTSVYIPKDLENKKDIYDLLNVVEILRGDDGCPWDREQSHDSIKMALVEESYEVVDAINNEDDNGLVEELGDVLLQVVFHSSLGKEEGYFEFGDVIERVYEKMIFRHPHVFKENKGASSKDEAVDRWEELKKKEKNFNTLSEEMSAIAKALPALTRAEKVQKKAKKVGFDWDDVNGAIDKVKEEINEVLEVYNGENKAKITEEIGDLLFATVNVNRFLGIDSEECLNLAIEKFTRRFSLMEEKVITLGKNLNGITLEEMDKYWEEVKKLEK